jgi:hypothetical protein
MSSLQLSRAQEKLRGLQEQLETKHSTIAGLEADIGALKAQVIAMNYLCRITTYAP